jgi:hypothetical protein
MQNVANHKKSLNLLHGIGKSKCAEKGFFIRENW